MNFAPDSRVSEDLERLIRGMLDKNPETRIKMHELIQNPWLNKNCNPLLTHPETDIVLTTEEINKAMRPIRGLVFAKLYGRKWRNLAQSKTGVN